ncbi:Rpp14/Pop5 family-domain-containing protein [Lasiosphaeria miniovina]|uniref:Ribonuclease P/MRP protein subunit POP5 n=1 Tax=Lasiosphaeria miniovina TaxID=1954250 RepID=A0AA40AU63_9PEZI|nr:Rpp14/Pop5 family-domain-containing protein [Lasiosphaeria miniovina]KAK0722086.1 Rpp14/Pop5 family-domain-containing protein [Lasiosphaeria miniovina]
MVRLKDRYLLVNIIYSDVPAGQQSKGAGAVPDLLVYNQPTTGELRPQLLLKSIRAEVAALFGDCGAGAIDRSLQVKYLSTATSTFILRISRSHYRLVWAALSFMHHVPVRNGRPCIFRVVRVSGTIRKVEEEAVRRAKLLILAAKREMAGKSSGALDALLRGKDDARNLTMVVDPDDDDSEPENGSAMDGG